METSSLTPGQGGGPPISDSDTPPPLWVVERKEILGKEWGLECRRTSPLWVEGPGNFGEDPPLPVSHSPRTLSRRTGPCPRPRTDVGGTGRGSDYRRMCGKTLTPNRVHWSFEEVSVLQVKEKLFTSIPPDLGPSLCGVSRLRPSTPSGYPSPVVSSPLPSDRTGGSGFCSCLTVAPFLDPGTNRDCLHLHAFRSDV